MCGVSWSGCRITTLCTLRTKMRCLTTRFRMQCPHVKQSTTTCCSGIHDISWFLAYLLSDCYVLLMRIYINIFYKSYQSLWYVYLIRGRLLEELPALQSLTESLQGENRVFPVKFSHTGKWIPCNENRLFPVKKTLKGKPCFHYRNGFAVRSASNE